VNASLQSGGRAPTHTWEATIWLANPQTLNRYAYVGNWATTRWRSLIRQAWRCALGVVWVPGTAVTIAIFMACSVAAIPFLATVGEMWEFQVVHRPTPLSSLSNVRLDCHY
jgi:hypothetical protein